MEKIGNGVHVTHCCLHHGCKYDAEDCPVETGAIAQAHPCEQCQEDHLLAREQVEVIVSNTARSIAEFLTAQGEQDLAREILAGEWKK